MERTKTEEKLTDSHKSVRTWQAFQHKCNGNTSKRGERKMDKNILVNTKLKLMKNVNMMI